LLRRLSVISQLYKASLQAKIPFDVEVLNCIALTGAKLALLFTSLKSSNFVEAVYSPQDTINIADIPLQWSDQSMRPKSPTMVSICIYSSSVFLFMMKFSTHKFRLFTMRHEQHALPSDSQCPIRDITDHELTS
jgi:hypothetical protein